MDADKINFAEKTQGNNVDLSMDIADIFGALILSQAQIYSISAAGNDDAAIINLFVADFYPKWVMFYGITRLGFDEQYKKEHADLVALLTTAENDIDTIFGCKPDKNRIKKVFKTFSDYTPHVKQRKMIKLNGS